MELLNGLIHIGENNLVVVELESAYGITEDLIKEGFEAGRMKTGTPPRVDGRSDYSKMNEEKGDARPDKFSYSDVISAGASKILS
jgi:tRNA uridine 5-carboxymethylaminomethyl modification enzyme